MNWNSLKIFLAIAANGSLSAAAKTLNINHSIAFRQLNSFEKEIGGRLFERLNYGYQLTPVGEDLLVFAENIASSFDDLERHIAGKDMQPKGVVKITAPNNITYRYLPRYLAEFHCLYPEIQIELLASNRQFNMTNRQADIAIRATPSPPEHLVGRQLRTIQWSVYGSQAYQHPLGLPRHLEQLQHHRLIGGTGGMRDLPGFIWLESHFSQQIEIRCDDLVTMSYLAEAGRGLAFLPDDQQRSEIEKYFHMNPDKPVSCGY